MQVLEFFAVHTAGKVGNQIHRPRAVERHEGDNLFKFGGLGGHQHFFHAGGLKLEHGGGVAFGKNFIGIDIVQRQLRHIDFFAAGGGNKILRHFDDGEVAQAQEVELHQAHFFHVALVVHRYRRGGFVGLIHRAEIGDFAGRNQYAAGVHTEAAGEVFQFFC